MCITKNKIYYIFVILLCLIICSGIIIYPSACAKGGIRGIMYCGNLLIPSLFPFMVISSFVVKSGVSYKIGKYIDKITQFIFKAEGCAGVTIFLSMIGGYPIGAKGLDELVKNNNISKRTAQRLILFCVGSGPAFLVGVVGTSLFNDKYIGIILFLSQSISTIIIGILSGFFADKSEILINKNNLVKKENLYSSIVASCNESVNVILGMCGFVVLFSSLMELLSECGFSQIFANFINTLGASESISKSLIYVLTEVTGGCEKSVNNGCSIIFVAFAVSWGGLCVHFQILSAIKSFYISYIKFIVFRMIHGILCCIFTYIFLKVYNPSTEVFSTYKDSPVITQSRDISLTVSLILLCIVFVFSCIGKSSRAVKYR